MILEHDSKNRESARRRLIEAPMLDKLAILAVACVSAFELWQGITAHQLYNLARGMVTLEQAPFRFWSAVLGYLFCLMVFGFGALGAFLPGPDEKKKPLE
jgi:hypothetical protein